MAIGNGKLRDAEAKGSRASLKLMLIHAQREASAQKLGLTCYLLGMAIESVDVPDQAIAQGVLQKVETSINHTT